MSGFCHFGLVLFMVLWQSPDTSVMSGFHVSARLRVCSLVCMPCFVLERGVRILALMSWVSVSWRRFEHLRSTFCLFVRVCGLVFAWPRTLLSTCVVFCVVARSSCFISWVHSCYVLCCVARSLCISLAACFYVVMSCVNTWLMGILISCVFVSCFALGWWFCFAGHVLSC